MDFHEMSYPVFWKQNAHGPQFAHLIKTAIAYLQMPCNFFQYLPQQLGHKFDLTKKRSTVILVSSFQQTK